MDRLIALSMLMAVLAAVLLADAQSTPLEQGQSSGMPQIDQNTNELSSPAPQGQPQQGANPPEYSYPTAITFEPQTQRGVDSTYDLRTTAAPAYQSHPTQHRQAAYNYFYPPLSANNTHNAQAGVVGSFPAQGAYTYQSQQQQPSANWPGYQSQSSYQYQDNRQPQPRPYLPVAPKSCGYVTTETGFTQCVGGFKCGCMVGEPGESLFPSLTDQHQQPHQQQRPVAMSNPTYTGVRQSSVNGVGDSYFGARHRCRRQAGGCPQYKWYCFSADTRVYLTGGRDGLDARRGWIPMEQLRVGDWIISEGSDGVVSSTRVDSWIHRMPEVWTDFVTLRLDDGRELKITEKHLIYRLAQCPSSANGTAATNANSGTASMVFADEVAVGDCLLTTDTMAGVHEDPAGKLVARRVVSVGKVHQRGIYSPLTGNNKLLVEGILASAFTLVENSILQGTMFKQPHHLDVDNGAEEEVVLPFYAIESLLSSLAESVLPSGIAQKAFA